MEYCEKCGYIKQQCECERTLTNANRIRNMSDDQLAEFLVSVEMHGFYDKSVAGSLEMLDWLKNEVN